MTEVAETVETNEEVDTQEDKTVAVAEMTRRLKKEQEKYEAELAKFEAEKAQAIQDAIEKAKVEATLTGKELEKYKQQEAEQKQKQLLDRIAELEREGTRRELKDEAIRTLGEKALPINERVLNFVVKDTAEETLQAIDDMAFILSEQKNNQAATTPPRTGGGMGTQAKGTTDVFDKAKITGF